jgi:hypothetical protein
MNDEKRFSASTPPEYSSQHPIFSLGRFKFVYGKNNEVQLLMWWPCDLKKRARQVLKFWISKQYYCILSITNPKKFVEDDRS